MEHEVIAPKDLSRRTAFLKEELWFNNIAENLPMIRREEGMIPMKNTCAGPCVVVGAGPSLEKFKQLEALKSFRVHIIATDRMLVPLLEKGIVPEYVLSVDADPAVADFYSKPIVEKYADRVKAVFAHQVHPSVAKYPGKHYWFTIQMDDIKQVGTSITRALYFMTNNKTAAPSLGNVGAFAWSLGNWLGHKYIMLIGLDFSYGPDVQPMQTLYWKGFLEMAKGNVQAALRYYRHDNNPFGYSVVTDALFDGYKEVLHNHVQISMAKTINCSPYTTLHGSRIACMPLEQALSKYTTKLS